MSLRTLEFTSRDTLRTHFASLRSVVPHVFLQPVKRTDAADLQQARQAPISISFHLRYPRDK
eukprot:3451717-Amphidinium_carterae.1